MANKRFIRGIRRAIAEISPGVLRSGRDGIRCVGHLEGLSGTSLRVSPINVAALGSCDRSVTLIIGDGDLCCTFPSFLKESERAVVLDLAVATVVSLPRRRRWHGTTCSLFVPGGIDGVQQLPVVSLSRTGCTISSERGLPIGQVLKSTEVLDPSGVLRCCDLSVIENVPWCDAQGRRSHRTRLGVVDEEPEDTPSSVISSAGMVDKILRTCAVLDVSTSFPTAAKSGARFVEYDGSQIRLSTSVGQLGPRDLTLRFELFGVLYSGRVRVLERKPRELVCTRPVVLRATGRRRWERIDVDSAPIVASYTHPLCGRVRKTNVVNLSASGAYVQVDKDSVPYWDGMPLRNVILYLGDKRFSLGHAHVVKPKSGAMGIAFTREPIPAFQSALLALRRPELPAHDGVDFDGQLEFYRRTHLLMPYMEEILERHFDVNRTTWRSAHENEAVAKTFARRDENKVVGSITALHTWDGTWMAQQLAVLPGRKDCSAGDLFLTFMDHVISRPECQRLMFGSTRKNRIMSRIFTSFAGLTGTNEAMNRNEVDIWIARHEPQAADDLVTVRRASARDLPMIENAAQREYGAETAEALCLNARSLFLPKLGALYASAGLARTRNVDIVSLDDSPTFAVIHEHASRGACLNGVVNASWLLPIGNFSERATADNRRALNEVLRYFGREHGEPSRIVITPSHLPREVFLNNALELVVELNLFVMNRSGLKRYVDFVNQSYGARERPSRKPSREQKRAAS